MQPPLPKDAAASNRALRSYLSWQRSMLVRDDRHVVVVGAGHVGTEFLMQALSHSRIWGTAFTFDVLDSVRDLTRPTAMRTRCSIHIWCHLTTSLALTSSWPSFGNARACLPQSHTWKRASDTCPYASRADNDAGGRVVRVGGVQARCDCEQCGSTHPERAVFASSVGQPTPSVL